jgi:hypothetical protein
MVVNRSANYFYRYSSAYRRFAPIGVVCKKHCWSEDIDHGKAISWRRRIYAKF